MFTAIEEKQILKLNDRLSRNVTISLINSAHEQHKAFEVFCNNLSHLLPYINISANRDGSPGDPPQILIGERLRFQAVPAGHELQPFLEALAAFGMDPPPIADTAKIGLKTEKLPANLILYIAPQCTYCPTAVRRLFPLPLADDQIRLTIIDGTLFPEAAEVHKISAVPTLLLDERFRWTGSVPLAEIINTINAREPASLGAASLENILKEGRAGHLAAMMLADKKIFPAFYDLIIHEKWPIRLGAMVVMEEIADQDPALAAEVIDFLRRRFQRLPDQVKGDILYLCGEIKDRRTIAWVEEVAAGDYHEEVLEAAKEAIEKMRE